jgi:hypothetical protein
MRDLNAAPPDTALELETNIDPGLGHWVSTSTWSSELAARRDDVLALLLTSVTKAAV